MAHRSPRPIYCIDRKTEAKGIELSDLMYLEKILKDCKLVVHNKPHIQMGYCMLKDYFMVINKEQTEPYYVLMDGKLSPCISKNVYKAVFEEKSGIKCYMSLDGRKFYTDNYRTSTMKTKKHNQKRMKHDFNNRREVIRVNNLNSNPIPSWACGLIKQKG